MKSKQTDLREVCEEWDELMKTQEALLMFKVIWPNDMRPCLELVKDGLFQKGFCRESTFFYSKWNIKIQCKDIT